ncbi:MAG: acyl carrier protein [Bacteroidota bacterium]
MELVMNQESVKTDLLEIIKPYLPEDVQLSDVSEEKHLINDLKINSAHIVDIVLDIEDKFDIMIDDDAIGEMNTVRDSIDVVLNKAAA